VLWNEVILRLKAQRKAFSKRCWTAVRRKIDCGNAFGKLSQF
jgi:hypothetical protein